MTLELSNPCGLLSFYSNKYASINNLFITNNLRANKMNVSIDLTTIEKLFSAEDKEPLRTHLIETLLVNGVRVKDHPLVRAFLNRGTSDSSKEVYEKERLIYTKAILIPVKDLNVDQCKIPLALTYEHFDQFSLTDIKNIIKYAHKTCFGF